MASGRCLEGPWKYFWRVKGTKPVNNKKHDKERRGTEMMKSSYKTSNSLSFYVNCNVKLKLYKTLYVNIYIYIGYFLNSVYRRCSYTEWAIPGTKAGPLSRTNIQLVFSNASVHNSMEGTECEIFCLYKRDSK